MNVSGLFLPSIWETEKGHQRVCNSVSWLVDGWLRRTANCDRKPIRENSRNTWAPHHTYKSESPREDLKQSMTRLLKCHVAWARKILHSDLRLAHKRKIYSVFFFHVIQKWMIPSFLLCPRQKSLRWEFFSLLQITKVGYVLFVSILPPTTSTSFLNDFVTGRQEKFHIVLGLFPSPS